MRIEFGFQANCSEIVMALDFATKEDIMEVMRTIEGITGWTWRGMARYQKGEQRIATDARIALLIPMDRLDELYLEFDEEGGKDHGIDLKRLVELHREGMLPL